MRFLQVTCILRNNFLTCQFANGTGSESFGVLKSSESYYLQIQMTLKSIHSQTRFGKRTTWPGNCSFDDKDIDEVDGERQPQFSGEQHQQQGAQQLQQGHQDQLQQAGPVFPPWFMMRLMMRKIGGCEMKTKSSFKESKTLKKVKL